MNAGAGSGGRSGAGRGGMAASAGALGGFPGGNAGAGTPGGFAGADAGSTGWAMGGTGGVVAGEAGSSGRSSDPKAHMYNMYGGRVSDGPFCVEGECPDGLKCFQLTREFGICDVPEREEVTECSPEDDDDRLPDECGCSSSDGGAGGEGGSTPEASACAEGRICARLVETCSCAPATYNACVERACDEPSDCPDSAVCIPPALITLARCAPATCRGDSDCTGYPEGLCVVVFNSPLQSGNLLIDKTMCR